MPIHATDARELLLENLNPGQQDAVSSTDRRLLVIAGAGSGKTEVMARRVAWWIAVEGISKDEVIAFTFTDAAAEELKFRIRKWLEKISLPDEDPTLGRMYIGTIHGFCLKVLREQAPDEYYVFDMLDESGRMSLLEQGYHNVLGLAHFASVAKGAGAASGKFDAMGLFIRGYDLLNEHDLLKVELSSASTPVDVREERDWCKEAKLTTEVGESDLAKAFADSAARYYAYLRARRFLDFSTVQTELTAKLGDDDAFLKKLRSGWKRVVVDEVQDINPVQDSLIRKLIGNNGHLTAVGDHRQAIYAFRGGRVDLMGMLSAQLRGAKDGKIVGLAENYRSTSRIINLSNEWSDTVGDTAGMPNPHMKHGRTGQREDKSEKHVSLSHFSDHEAEAEWIADTISRMVKPIDQHTIGAYHDDNGRPRGLSYSDIAILVRSSTDIRTYQDALRTKGIPAVVRGGPDLFSQPEVLLFLAALAICADIDAFFGAPHNPNSLPSRIERVLGAAPEPEAVVAAAAKALGDRGIAIANDAAKRLMTLSQAISHRLGSSEPLPVNVKALRCKGAKQFLQRNRQPRRVFPQTIFHWLLEEAGIGDWESKDSKRVVEAARFHVGQLSSLVKGMETSGWTTAGSMKWQMIALLTWGAGAARTSEAPLMVAPDAVTITTIHSAKGLEFPAVFVADVKARRFPSSRAKIVPKVPFDSVITNGEVDPHLLADNDNNDQERRLMYVALTRAERYLFITYSGRQKSKFIRELEPLIKDVGGTVTEGGFDISKALDFHPSSEGEDNRLATSFSDLRYYLECPQDFYMRVVLGYTPTIDQAFGYGRGVHNLLRAIHSDPKKWAVLSADPAELQNEVRRMIDRGMFYMRYTTGEPLENLQRKAQEGVTEYVQAYSNELANLEFEPEREFETLIADENLLISGAIDVVRLDNPPRVTIVDFKSGDSDGDTGSGLIKELMELQIGVYGLAARHELEYDPQHGLVRYIGERDSTKRELKVNLDDKQLAAVKERIVETGRSIRRRDFDRGPSGLVPNRCSGCDFVGICGRSEAAKVRNGSA